MVASIQRFPYDLVVLDVAWGTMKLLGDIFLGQPARERYVDLADLDHIASFASNFNISLYLRILGDYARIFFTWILKDLR